MRIGGIIDMSTVDWYGNPSLVLFFAGCNFRCPYCQNPKIIPRDAGAEMDLEMLRQRITMNNTPVQTVDAVVFTGGEPTIQSEGVLKAAELVKELRLKLMLDTNGSRPHTVKQLLERGLLDRIALDVKAPFNHDDYKRAAGLRGSEDEAVKTVEAVRRTLELCNRYGIEVEVRTTVAPTISDEPEFIRRIASSLMGLCDVYYLQQFDNTGDVLSRRLKELRPPDRETMMRLAEAALEEGLRNVYIKTRELGLERVG